LCLLFAFMSIGCATTKISDQQPFSFVQFNRPGQIWVYDFVAPGSDFPQEIILTTADKSDITPKTASQIEEEQKLGAAIRSQLVKQIQSIGMPAMQALPSTIPLVNDLVIRGYLINVSEGSVSKRLALGFGSGASELEIAVETFQVVPTGVNKLESKYVNARSGKTPGLVMSVAGLLASGNPAGLIISSGIRVYAMKTGTDTVNGRARSSSKAIVTILKKQYQEQGWIADDS